MKSRPRGARFGYPDMNPATLLFLTQELRRARANHPSNEKNWKLIDHYRDQLHNQLSDYRRGFSDALTVQMTALQIAVMAIRLSEEGVADHPYKGNIRTVLPGPMGELERQMDAAKPNPEMDALTERVTNARREK